MLETARPTGYLALLRQRNFSLLWLSGLLAYFAIWTSNIVVMDVVYEAMHNDSATAIILTAQFLPAFFLMPFAGRILDRYDRRLVILATKFLNAGLAVVLLFWAAALPATCVVAVYVLYSISTTMFIISEGAVLPLIVGQSDLMRANVLLRISPCVMLVMSAAFIANREVGAAPTDEFGAIVVLFLISAAVFSRIPALHGRDNDAAQQGDGLFREFFAGMGYLVRHRDLAQVFVVRMALYVGVGAQALLSMYAETLFKLGESGTSLLYMARGTGLLIGGFALAPLALSKGMRRAKTVRDGLILFGLGYLLASVLSGFGIGMVAIMLCVGFLGEGLLKPITMALVQQQADAAFLARVLAAEQGLCAAVQSATAALIAAFVTEARATVLWASGLTGGLLIAVAMAVSLSNAATAIDIGDTIDGDVETTAAEVLMP